MLDLQGEGGGDDLAPLGGGHPRLHASRHPGHLEGLAPRAIGGHGLQNHAL